MRILICVLAGHSRDFSAGCPATTEWTDQGVYLDHHGGAVLSSLGAPGIPGAVLQPLVDREIHLRGLRHPGLAVPMTALAEVGRAAMWMRRPAGSKLAEPDERRLKV